MDAWQARVMDLAEKMAENNGIAVTRKHCMRYVPGSVLPEHIYSTIEGVCDDLDISHTRLTSYAGHDAQVMSSFTPTGMIFIPSVAGISHSPREFTQWEHVVKGANALLHSALTLAEQVR